ncbi:MAG: amidohydrolase family protein [Acidobacteria bacterium]|nr:amidohydrolase family protein [Acidobacteriota bacterium]
MNGRFAWRFAVAVGVFGGALGLLRAQQQAPPDLILYNGKIVTMNDHGVNANVGAIAQALAIRGNSIVAVGTDAQIRAMAGSNTKSWDLKGRTITPGYGGTHDHPMDWDTINPYIVRKVITDDNHIERFIWDTPPEKIMSEFTQVLDEAVRKAKPGQWVRISVLYGKKYLWSNEVSALFGRQITKQMLDTAAPNNPVQVRGGFIGQVLNQKAIDTVKQHYGEQWEKFVWNPFSSERTDTTGLGVTNYRWLEQDVLYRLSDLEEIYRLGLSWMGGYGVTLNSSGLYTPGAVRAYNDLDRKAQLAIRVPWSYQWRPRPDFWSDPYLPEFAAAMVGKGSDYLWLTGLWPSDNAADCFTLPRRTAGGGGQGGEGGAACHFSTDWRGGENAIALCNMVKAGGRLAGIHTGGDKDIEFLLDIIERCSKEAGLTLDQIRSIRHAYDHMGGSPRPDQVARVKNLGMVIGGYNMQLWEGGAERFYNMYGEKAVEWMQPRKSLYDSGVYNSVEIDRPIGYTDLTYMHVLWIGITRKDKDGKVWAPSQAISREAMLKSATYAGAYYSKHENVLGSLEPGKWADLAVLDRDYMAVPVDDIPKLRVLMTMVGGKVIHLVPSLAREIGMSPTGAQVELGGPAAQW